MKMQTLPSATWSSAIPIAYASWMPTAFCTATTMGFGTAPITNSARPPSACHSPRREVAGAIRDLPGAPDDIEPDQPSRSQQTAAVGAKYGLAHQVPHVGSRAVHEHDAVGQQA